MTNEDAGGAVAGSRFIVRETGDGLGIVVPRARDNGLFFFLQLFLIIWAAAGCFFFFLEPALLPEGWVWAWFAAGVPAIGLLAWQLFATERLFITGGAMVLSRGLGFLGRRRIYRIGEAKQLRIRTVYVAAAGKSRGLVPRSFISFEAGGKTHDFGADMEAGERSAVYYAILRHLPPDAAAVQDANED